MKPKIAITLSDMTRMIGINGKIEDESGCIWSFRVLPDATVELYRIPHVPESKEASPAESARARMAAVLDERLSRAAADDRVISDFIRKVAMIPADRLLSESAKALFGPGAPQAQGHPSQPPQVASDGSASSARPVATMPVSAPLAERGTSAPTPALSCGPLLQEELRECHSSSPVTISIGVLNVNFGKEEA